MVVSATLLGRTERLQCAADVPPELSSRGAWSPIPCNSTLHLEKSNQNRRPLDLQSAFASLFADSMEVTVAYCTDATLQK